MTPANEISPAPAGKKKPLGLAGLIALGAVGIATAVLNNRSGAPVDCSHKAQCQRALEQAEAACRATRAESVECRDACEAEPCVVKCYDDTFAQSATVREIKALYEEGEAKCAPLSDPPHCEQWKGFNPKTGCPVFADVTAATKDGGSK